MSESGTPDEAWTAYRNAFTTVEKSLVPNAEALCATNLDILEATYADEKSKSAMLCSAVLAFGIILTATLILSQIYL